MLRKVIFVSGTSYSGSTMLDMTLANDPAGFSCGQVNNFFRPIRPYQVDPLCGCGERDCTVWRQIHRAGSQNLYSSISAIFPEVTFVVDSSKDPCWAVRQERVARAQGLEVLHVLTWKSPQGLAKSFAKRGRSDKFAFTYLNYHRIYNALISPWVGVQHERLVEDPQILALLCERLGIDMFDAKSEFWTKRHHTLFGNDSAKISLYSRDHPRFASISQQRRKIDGESSAPVAEHRHIYRKQDDMAFTLDSLGEQDRREVERIAIGLAANSVATTVKVGRVGSRTTELPRASKFACRLRCTWGALRRSFAGIRYRQRFAGSSSKV